MKALQIRKGELQVQEVPPPIAAGEALVRVRLAGICNTDLEIVRGYAGFEGTLGHEFVGVVEESPDPSWVGDRVVGEINAGCGDCVRCQAGDPRHCDGRTVLGIVGRDGAFADLVRLPLANLVRVPEGVSDRQAVLTEPLAAAGEILNQTAVGPGHRVAVLGDGKLGQLIARVLATTGCRLLLVGKHPRKLALAERAGVEGRLVDDLAVSPAERFDLVVEATGSPVGLARALEWVRPRGVVVLKSTFHGPVTVDTSRLVVDEITLLGSRCGRFDQALALLAAGEVEVDSLLEAQYPLTEGVAAMAHAARPGVMKVLLEPAW
jgi:threonine dehydrogenase-like Zn-dependent dehydrogenase